MLAFVRLRTPCCSPGRLACSSFSVRSHGVHGCSGGVEPATPLDSGNQLCRRNRRVARPGDRRVFEWLVQRYRLGAICAGGLSAAIAARRAAVGACAVSVRLRARARWRADAARIDRDGLRRGAWIGLGAGLPANLGLGFFGTLAGFGARPELDSPWLTLWADFGQTLGGPLLAVGYLCALSLRFIDQGTPSLAAVGRMALTAYLMQSALALVAFGALRLYDRLSSTSALLVVAVIWTVLLVMCPWWLRRFQLGPAEWLWRSLTYGRLQPLRREP